MEVDLRAEIERRRLALIAALDQLEAAVVELELYVSEQQR